MDVALLQVGDKAVAGLSASASGSRVTVRRAFADALEESFESIAEGERGKALLEVLKRNKFDGRRVVLAIPRRFVIFREFAVPAGDAGEVASMIRFQLEKELPVPVSRIKYVAHELGRDNGQLRVVVASVPVEVVDPLIGALEDVGIKVSSVVLGTMGLAMLAPKSDKPVGIKYVFDGSLELLVWSPGKVLSSHSSSVHGMSDEEVSDHVRRMLMAYSEDADEPLDKLHITRSFPDLVKRLGETVPVEQIDLKAITGGDKEPPQEIVPLVGAALGLAGRSPWVKDLLAPPIPKKISKTVVAARLGALIGVLLVGLIIYLRLDASDVEARARKLSSELKKGKGVPKKLKEFKAQRDEILEWAENRPRWIDVLADLNEVVDTKKVFLESVNFDSMGGMTLVGRARSRESANDLAKELNASTRFRDAVLSRAEDIGDEGRDKRRKKDPTRPYKISFNIVAVIQEGEPIR